MLGGIVFQLSTSAAHSALCITLTRSCLLESLAVRILRPRRRVLSAPLQRQASGEGHHERLNPDTHRHASGTCREADAAVGLGTLHGSPVSVYPVRRITRDRDLISICNIFTGAYIALSSWRTAGMERSFKPSPCSVSSQCCNINFIRSRL